ncbi:MULTISPECIES: chromosomal replication initiator protein DnaA [Sphaerochaeta]|jgi:chromosomal replication initiator protein|uniref:Chromosomal replication initiator protein DnaA n=2 Tax=root TaxID=1 RepID=A0ABY4DA43_9SPIR|nr:MULTISPECIES: chromosomal replication initiator protein DnaA [Sphaerochaeta]MDT3359293.1 chromosomal replication initiator protein DnaA [Spirochaetota bacterium]MDD2394176.1 chromosomal replication initiator protein DnaA [Sphaerochaeta sp.]MDD3456399.1 chromosomal replication initiator protein DnaA [Sphaerochaeta sp.]MDX9982874.1 chromosomal replication initiator protein DnaA [Sphaerochaeta sp.]MEA5106305.1 chromosomal replication initiator protein DnaA [Sphaerochaeta associata]
MSDMHTTYYEFWQETASRIKDTLPEQEYNTWFNRIAYLKSENKKVLLAGASQFILDTVIARYRDLIVNTLSELTGEDINVEFVVVSRSEIEQINKPEGTAKDKEEKAEPVQVQAKPKISSEKTLRMKEESNLNPSYDFGTFVIGDNSAFAYNASLAIAKNPGVSYNPCLIYGGVGLGKTHLLNSIGNYIINNTPELKVMYVTAEMFTNEFIESIGSQRTQHFKNKFRKVDVLLIDDIHFLQGKDSTQEELFHTFNNLYESKKQMVFTCDRPISELKNITDRLSSRFERGLNVDLQPPNYETRMAILKKKLVERGSSMSEEILNYIATNVCTNVRDLESSLTKLIAYSELLSQEISFDKAKELLGILPSLAANANQTLSIDTIIKVVGEYFNVSSFEIKGKKKNKSLIQPRQISMYLARDITEYSTTEIGTEFGGRDHTTVMHAYDRIESLMKGDEAFANTILKLKRDLTNVKK